MKDLQNDRDKNRSEQALDSTFSSLALRPPVETMLKDIEFAWDAHQQHSKEDSGTFRRFDPLVPYAVHPVWCSTTILTEPNLSSELRQRGAQALVFHDVLEDTTKALPSYSSPQLLADVDQMTFPLGSWQERLELFSLPKEIRLFKLYDKVSNALDGVWRNEQQIAIGRGFLRRLNDDVKHHFPNLNISLIADALLATSHKVWPIGNSAPQYRVSVANLVPAVRVNGEHHFVGILNRKHFAAGRRVYGALGGAAEMLEAGKTQLEEESQAEFNEGQDARFLAPADKLETVVAQFENPNAQLCEIDPLRELREELCDVELQGFDPVLQAEDLSGVKTHYLYTIRQPISTRVGSARESTSVPSRRVFNLFEMEVGESVFRRMKSHESLRFFSAAELKQISEQGTTNDGAAIANNLFLV